MKKNLLFAACAALFSLASCNKEAATPDIQVHNFGKGEQIAVSLNVAAKSAPATKAFGDLVSDEASERAIKRLDIFFFKTTAGQVLDTWISKSYDPAADGAATITDFSVSNEVLDCYVIANAPASLSSAVSSVATLKAAVADFTQNSAANGFVMIGYQQYKINDTANDSNAALSGTGTAGDPWKITLTGMTLERIANRIHVQKITNGFTDAGLADATITLEGMYVINATKSVKYTEYLLGSFNFPSDNTSKADVVPAAADASYWNFSDPFEVNPFITQRISSSNTIVAAPGLARNDMLYFYPNPAAQATATAENIPEDYVTKLVLLVKIEKGGVSNLYWYPIGIPQVAGAARNLSYEISNITLTKMGSNANGYDPETNSGDPVNDPNEYIDYKSLEIQMTVKDWVSAEITGSYNNGVTIEQ